jgi:hypothetical protein
MQHLFRVAVSAAGIVLGAATAHGQIAYDPNTDPNMIWWRQNIRPHLEAMRPIQEDLHRQFQASLTPQQRQQYQQCLAQGTTEANCRFMVQQNQGMERLHADLAALDRAMRVCQRGDRRACAQAEEIQERYRRLGRFAELQGQVEGFRARQSQDMRRHEQAMRDRETAGRYRMEGWRHDNRRKEAEGRRDHEAAEWHRREADRAYGRAREYQPR